MYGLQLVAGIIGRILLSAIFILAGLNKILNWEASKEVLLNMLSTWGGYATFPWMHPLIDVIRQYPGWCLSGALVCELLGGILVLFGVGARFGALLLIIFIIPTTILFHAFWELQPPERDIQTVMFMKNAAILGGLFVVFAFGSGFVRRCSSPKDPL
jgi:putative oxidoreductase